MKKAFCGLIMVMLVGILSGCLEERGTTVVETINKKEYKVIESMVFGDDVISIEYSEDIGRAIISFPTYKKVVFVNELGAITSQYAINDKGEQVVVSSNYVRDVELNESGYLSRVKYENYRDEGYYFQYNNVIDNELTSIALYEWDEPESDREYYFYEMEDLANVANISDISYTTTTNERLKMFGSELWIGYFCLI